MIFFAQCGNYILTPTVVAKMFGSKHFTSIYGSIILLASPASFIKAGLSEIMNVIGWFWLFMTGCCFSILG